MATVKTFLKDGFRHFQCNDEEACLRLSFLIKDAGYGFKMSSNWVKKHTEFKILAEKDPMKDLKVIKGAKALRINLEEAKGKKASTSDILRNLESRIARLEKQAASSRYSTFRELFFLAKEKSKKLKTLETGVLEKGSKAIVADNYDMIEFLTTFAKATTKSGREIASDVLRKNVKYLIVEDQHPTLGSDGVIKVIEEHELGRPKDRRNSISFYLWLD